MNVIKIKSWQVVPIFAVAFITGYFFKWLTKDHSISEVNAVIWLSVLTTFSAIVIAFVLGAHQANAVWKSSIAVDEQSADRSRASFVGIVTAAFGAMDSLDDRYQHTHADRMRLRVAYQADTFATLIEALAVIPVHRLESVDAVIALVGLRKNMVDAQLLIERYIADKSRYQEGQPVADAGKGLDLRACKAHAASHYRNLVQALKTY
jgi:hypothetical protein